MKAAAVLVLVLALGARAQSVTIPPSVPICSETVTGPCLQLGTAAAIPPATVTSSAPTPAAAAPLTLPDSFYAIGGAYDSSASPHPNGWASYGKLVSSSTTKGLYSFTTLDIFRASTSVRTGFLQIVWRAGALTLGVLGDAGVASGAAASLTGAFSGGAAAFYSAKDFTIVFCARPTKAGASTRMVYEMGIGRSF